eukprot:CAMPEP_0170074908 /NCGR_PEP_ID=MMETSP0019_2-20121128/12142_1 /TAXON_ID=98059 /ORGANISM="Dinobryon sp., Strain UTEXLB2267" /LENGTH=81 /DNA_ID=CAMNT_0010285541 /DNA_START=200 /DNA_END=442 /DNA_ORIENTATION=-
MTMQTYKKMEAELCIYTVSIICGPKSAYMMTAILSISLINEMATAAWTIFPTPFEVKMSINKHGDPNQQLVQNYDKSSNFW